MRLSDSPRKIYLAAGAVVLVICVLVATLWLSYEKVEALENLVAVLKSQSDTSTELIWIQEQQMHSQAEVIRLQGEQISALESQISTFEDLVESLNSLSTASETQPR